MPLDISSSGFQNYLKLYSPYSVLFTATFIVITANLAIERLGLMNDANLNSYKASNRAIWIQTVKEFLIELNIENPLMSKEFKKQLIIIHDYLFEKSYKISNESETADLFNTFFLNRIQFFEEMNTRFINIGYYPNESFSYCWDGFRYIIVVMVNIDECYPKFVLDMEKLYKAEVLKFSKDHIDLESYKFNLVEYSKRKRDGIDFK